jgi:hypothetical protein
MKTIRARLMAALSIVLAVLFVGCGTQDSTSTVAQEGEPAVRKLAAPSDPPQLSINTASYQLISSERVSRTTFLYTYRVNVVNSGGNASNVRAVVSSSSGTTVVTDGDVNFGDVAVNGTVASLDTFTVRHDRSKPFDTAALVWTVSSAPTPGPAALRVLPMRLSMNVEEEAVLLALNATGPVTWSSSDPNVLMVESTGAIKAIARGNAVITASSGSTAATTTIQVYTPSGATPDPTSENLIAQALAAGRIDAESALIFRMFAVFGDDRLPPEYRGAPDNTPHANVLREVAGNFNNLSPDTQATLQPFLLPPIYAESRFAQQLGLSAPATSSSQLVRKQAVQISCLLSTILERRSTAHFNIWSMPTDISRQQAEFIASVVEEIYAAETGLLNRHPLPDTEQSCNGGDGALDIYVFPTSISGKIAETVAYPGNCEATPAYIVINEMETLFYFIPGGFDPEASKQLIKGPLVHELLHAIQFGMDRAAACEDYTWIDEATAQWAIDFVYPNLNSEDGLEKTRSLLRSGTYFTDYLLGGHMAALEKPSNADNANLNGYSDYIFFQFLAREYGAATMEHLFNAWVRDDSVKSLDVALAAVGTDMKTAWPEFAKVIWNDYEHQVLDDLYQWDGYDYGVAKAFDQSQQYARPLKTVKVDQQGAKRASFELLQNAAAFGGGFQLEPRSMFFERLTFTDETVSSVLVSNPIPGLNAGSLRLHAVMKIGGQWKPAEDWTNALTKFFCRDKQGERLEELILIVSNSDATATLPADKPLMVSTSNVGCWKWQGTSSTRTTSASEFGSGDMTASATDVVFEPRLFDDHRLVLDAVSGTASGNATAVDLLPCTITQTGEATPITPAPIAMVFNLDLKSHQIPDSDRKLSALAATTLLNTTIHQVCPKLNIDATSSGIAAWIWAALPQQTMVSVSDDGRTIEGNITEPGDFGQAIYQFRFTAMRE